MTGSAMTESGLREEICRVGKSLFDRGYVHATAGNISVQLDAAQGGGFLITPTDACLGYLEPVRLARVDVQGQQISGDRASKTLVLHRRIYEASAGTVAPAHCIIHTHSTHCVALTLSNDGMQDAQPAGGGRELLPALTPYFVMKVGHVPVIDYRRPGDPQAAEAVAWTISRYHDANRAIRAVMLERLGPNVWHDSPAAAMATLEELEETARLWQMTRADARGGPKPLAAGAIDELRSAFGSQW